MQPILLVGIIIFTGFVFGEIAAKLKLPKVTGYITAGVLLNPRFFNFISEDFIGQTDTVANIALSFITFTIGSTLFFPRIKKLGKSIVIITLLEAEFAFAALILGFLAISPFFIHLPNATWLTTFIPLSILIGTLGSPTDPSPTLAVAHEYNAKGDVTSTIMGVSASDDVLGIINFSLGIVIAKAFILHEHFGLYPSVVEPLISIAGSVVLGIIFGIIFNMITVLIQKETEGVYIVVILSLLSICFGVATLLNIDQLLGTMVMGIVVVNFNHQREKIFKVFERYTEELIFVLFFTLSGMHLNLAVLPTSCVLILFFTIFRAIGKATGVFAGGIIAKSPPNVKRYTFSGLIPVGGLVVGLALMMKQIPAFDAISDIIINVIIGATIIHELIGPIFIKMALRKSGEIKAG
ncbi:MAG: cation:proton antiporter [Candidatus Omnitrophica bacterium]|nr:cation:proton antiporter [Candidatus Omnitrophota bacterium]